MRTQSTIIRTVLSAAAVLAVAPGVASANPLLSGYGGPGEGNQAILGAALLKGPSGGGGGSGPGADGGSGPGGGSVADGGSGVGAGAAGAAGAGAGTGVGQARSSVSGSSQNPAAPRTRSHRARAVSGAQVGVAAASYPVSEANVGSRTAGLSGPDLAYVVLALGGIALAAALTIGLTRNSAREREGGVGY